MTPAISAASKRLKPEVVADEVKSPCQSALRWIRRVNGHKSQTVGGHRAKGFFEIIDTALRTDRHAADGQVKQRRHLRCGTAHAQSCCLKIFNLGRAGGGGKTAFDTDCEIDRLHLTRHRKDCCRNSAANVAGCWVLGAEAALGNLCISQARFVHGMTASNPHRIHPCSEPTRVFN